MLASAGNSMGTALISSMIAPLLWYIEQHLRASLAFGKHSLVLTGRRAEAVVISNNSSSVLASVCDRHHRKTALGRSPLFWIGRVSEHNRSPLRIMKAIVRQRGILPPHAARSRRSPLQKSREEPRVTRQHSEVRSANEAEDHCT